MPSSLAQEPFCAINALTDFGANDYNPSHPLSPNPEPLMDPVTAPLLVAAFAKVAETLAEKLLTDSALEPAQQRLKKWLHSGYDRKKAEEELRQAFIQAIRKLDAPEEDDEALVWLRNRGLDRLQAPANHALREQFALAVLSFTDPTAQPPAELMTSLGWARSRAAELAQLLKELRASLAGSASWQPLLTYADNGAVREELQKINASLKQLNAVLVSTPQGDALRVVLAPQGMGAEEAERLERRYREALRKEFTDWDLRGIDPSSVSDRQKDNPALNSVSLESAYLELGVIPLRSEHTREQELHEEMAGEDYERLQTDLRREQKRLSDVLEKNPRMVLTGKPGSGKTMSLHFLVLMLSQPNLGISRLRLEKPYLPVYFRLADYADKLKHTSTLSLEQHLLQNVAPYYQPDPRFAVFLERVLEDGLCFILLDGLDEVGDLGDTLKDGKTLRERVLEEVKRFTRQKSCPEQPNRILVTSRLEGYRQGDLPGFSEVELSSLALPEEVLEFLVRWFAAREQKNHPELPEQTIYSRAADSAKGLMQQIMLSASVQRLSINPLLLGILALLHQLGISLPKERVRLYQTVTKTLVESWRPAQTKRGVPSSLSIPKISSLLSRLAYWVHVKQPGGAMPQPEWEQRVREMLREEDEDDSAEEIETKTQEFMRHITEQAGLLSQRSPGRVGFFHLTFEEYLTGIYIAKAKEEESREIVQNYWQNQRWREPLILAAGQLMLEGSSRLNEFVNQLRTEDVDAAQPEQAALPAILAGKAIADVGVGSFKKRTVRETYTQLQEWAVAGDLSAPTRAAIADLSDELGYEPGDLFDFMEISPTAFYMAKYPVTNGQYERFLQAENFARREFWVDFPVFDENGKALEPSGEAGWKWLQRQLAEAKKEGGGGEVLYPRYWQDARFGRSRRNAPLVDVTWYEANAYCKWLSAQSEQREHASLRDKTGKSSFRFRLPTEAEWVAAATSPSPTGLVPQSGRWAKGEGPYAFGDKAKKELPRYANTKESGIGRTTPVWMYPEGVSEQKVMDLSGNVWEWQANYYSKSRSSFGLRGGSWSNNELYARVSSRYGSHPSGGWYDRGFRLLLPPHRF